MAYLIKTTGEVQEVHPANGEDFTVAELHNFVGGYLEHIDSSRLLPRAGRLARLPIGQDSELWINEDGKQRQLPLNSIATLLYIYGSQDPIVGNAVLSKVRWSKDENGEQNDIHY
jgi:hypothetical protein